MDTQTTPDDTQDITELPEIRIVAESVPLQSEQLGKRRAPSTVRFETTLDLSDVGSLITQAPQMNSVHATINALSAWISAVQPRKSWYLAGWIDDSPIDFLVDPGAVVSSLSLQCYTTPLTEAIQLRPLLYNYDPFTREKKHCRCNPVTIPARTRIARVEEIQAIQKVSPRVTDRSEGEYALPPHLISVLDAATELTRDQRARAAALLAKHVNTFPAPGSPITGRTDAVVL